MLPGNPNAADLLRLRKARTRARVEVISAGTAYTDARRAAFNKELASTVRCASPFLLSLLTLEALDLRDVIGRVKPMAEWPHYPRLSRVIGTGAKVTHAFRYRANGLAPRYPAPGDESLHGLNLPLDDGGWAQIRIVAHSVEVRATIGTLVFETRFGKLRITTAKPLPIAITVGTIGRLVDDVVGHPTIDGRGWRVLSAENSTAATIFVVATGAARWSMV